MEGNYTKLDLPSRYIPYQNDGINEIFIRSIKGRDEKLISELNLKSFDKKFYSVLKTVTTGMDPLKLTVGDRQYIVIWIIINCYSRYYPIETQCENCLEKVDLSVDLTKLEKVELTDEYKEPYELKLFNGDIVNLRLFRVEDHIKYEDYVSRVGAENILYKMALCFMDKERDLSETISYLENLEVRDTQLIRQFHEKFFHGVDLSKYEYECPKCKEVGFTPVPFRLELFVPDGDSLRKTFGHSV